VCACWVGAGASFAGSGASVEELQQDKMMAFNLIAYASCWYWIPTLNLLLMEVLPANATCSQWKHSPERECDINQHYNILFRLL
jgi:hypothetical protein